MTPVEPQPEATRGQLERILESAGFARNKRMSGFLRFIVEHHLDGRGDELKESVIAVEVFGRSPDFNPKRDPIVRTEAARLRARLNEYYLNGGRTDPIIIDLPKGGYAPVLRWNEVRAESLPPPVGSDRQPHSVRLKTVILVVCLVATGTAAVLWRVYNRTKPIPVAVIPFQNVGPDSEDDYFSDGLTSEIIRDLSVIDGLAVRSQTSSFALKGKPRNIREAGKQLEADYVLEGSVLRADRQLRINVQLIRVRDASMVWSDRFDRKLTDVLRVQDEISRGIVNSLRVKLGGGRRRYETSAEAYNLYLRARALQSRLGLRGYNRSIDPLEKAVAIDHFFAPAYAALAVSYVFRSGQFGFEIPEQIEKMRKTAEEAIRLDPLSWEAHLAAGMTAARDGRWQESEQSFRRSIQLNPRESLPHGNLAFFALFPLGRVREALNELATAERLDPLSSLAHHQMASVLMAAGQHRDAETHCAKIQSDFRLKDECLGWSRLRQGRTDEVIQTTELALVKGSRGSPLRAVLGCAYVRAGRREDAENLAAESAFNSLNQAFILICLGDKDRAFEALDRAAVAGPIRMGWELEMPEFGILRGDPRLNALRKNVGLPE